MINKRNLKISVISDTHLGTYGSHAEELFQYLSSIEPEILVLNGDIIDAWNFNKNQFSKMHLAVVRKLLSLALNGTKIYYITGNHDEFLRAHSPMKIQNLILDDKLVLEVDGELCWFFHGDIFDATIEGSKLLAKLGGKGYDYLIWLNHVVNKALAYFNRPKMSLSQKIKNSVKQAAKYINDFEMVAAELAIQQQYDRVFCGHIHQPQMRHIMNQSGSVMYMNSGDWIENLSALEYIDGEWTIYRHEASTIKDLPIVSSDLPSYDELRKEILTATVIQLP